MQIVIALFVLILILLAMVALGKKYLHDRDLKSNSQGDSCGDFSVPEDLYPFEHHFMDLPGGERVHYVDEGPRNSSHTLLFLHGNPTWSLLYHHIIKNLRSSYRCIAPDYPGFGLSTAPPGYSYKPALISATVEAFLDRLKPDPFTMMVQDWGGPIGLGLAGRRPEFIERLVIGNTWAWPAKPGGRKEFFSKLMGGPIGRFLARHFNGVARILLYFGSSRGLSKQEFEMYLRPFEGDDCGEPTVILPREITKSAAYLREVEEGLKRIADRPTLILWGTDDWAFSTEDRKRFEQTFPNHKTIFLEGANHFIQEDAPARISEAIREFLETEQFNGALKPTPASQPAVAA